MGLDELSRPEFRHFELLLERAGLDATMARRLLENPDQAMLWVNQLKQQLYPSSMKLFCMPEEQLEMLRRWNGEYNLGFTLGQFSSAADAIPPWPIAPLRAVLLSWSLDTPQRTADMSWRIAAANQLDGVASRTAGDGEFRPALASGIRFQAWKLRWQLIDLAANRQTSELPSNELWAKACMQTSAVHAQGLQAAAYFPRWVRAMGTAEVPHIYLGGYRVPTQGNMKEGIPALYGAAGSRGHSLILEWPTHHYRTGWAVPKCLGKS